jgi:hypothetical protein
MMAGTRTGVRSRRAAVVLPRSPFWAVSVTAPLDDGMAVLPTLDGEPMAMQRLDLVEDRIRSMHSVLLPA